MATWPGTLPSFTDILESSYKESSPDNVIESQPSVGPPKARLRTTAGVVPFSGSMYLTSTQAGHWDTFYGTTINYGADEFDAVHPRTGSAISAILIGQPTILKMGAGWQLSFTAGILP